MNAPSLKDATQIAITHRYLKWVILSIALAVTATAKAADWTASSSGNWHDAGNWSGGVPNAVGASANFTNVDLAADLTVNLNNPATVGNMTLGDSTATYYSYTISGANTLTFDDSDTLSDLIVTQGTANVISTPVSLGDNLTIMLQNSAKLTISGMISGSRYLDLLASTGTLRLEGSNTFSGGVYLRGNPGGPPVLEIAHDNALGTGALSPNNYTWTLLSNVKGSTLTLANTFNPSGAGASYNFTNGDFLLTGTVNGGGNGGPAYRISAGVTVTVQNGITSDFVKDGAGTLRLLGPCGGRLDDWYAGPVEIYHDQALGTSASTIPLRFWGSDMRIVPCGGSRTLDNKFSIANNPLDIGGTNDLTLTGQLSGSGSLRMYGTGILTLNGSNTYSLGTTINAGTVVAGNKDALGIMADASRKVTVNSDGTLAVAAGVTNSPDPTYGDSKYVWNAGSAIGGSGTFQRTNAWTLPANFTVRPGIGATPGTLTVETAGYGMTFGDNRTMEIDLSGTNADRLVLDGALNLSGTTDKLVVRGTAKPNTYVIASATSVNGVFNQEDVTGLVNTRGRVIYLTDQILFRVLAPGTVVAIQ